MVLGCVRPRRPPAGAGFRVFTCGCRPGGGVPAWGRERSLCEPRQGRGRRLKSLFNGRCRTKVLKFFKITIFACGLRPGMPCVSNSLEDEDIDSQRPEPQLQGRRDTGVYGTPDFRNLFRGARSTLSGRRVRLFPVQPRRRADRRRTAGRRHLRRVVLNAADIPIRRWRCAMRCRRCRCRSSRCTSRRSSRARSSATSRSWLPWPWARSWVSGWIPTGWASRPCCSAAGSKLRVPGAAHSPARYGRACGSFPGLSAQSVCRSGTGRNVKCRNTNI